MSAYSKALARAKALVVASGRTNVFAHVCRERGEFGGPDEIVVMSNAEYQECGNEEACVASVWSYEDGQYDWANVFRPNGKIAAAVEEHE